MSKVIEKQVRFAWMFGELMVWAHQVGIKVVLGDGWRSTAKLKLPGSQKKMSYQELLKYNGKSQVTYGNHNKRLAHDVILIEKGKPSWDREAYRELGEKWEKLGGKWGGKFGVPRCQWKEKVGWDPGHFEL